MQSSQQNACASQTKAYEMNEIAKLNGDGIIRCKRWQHLYCFSYHKLLASFDLLRNEVNINDK